MSDIIGNSTSDTSTLESKIQEVTEIVENISNLNKKYSGWLETMDSKYVDKQIDEIDAVERETRQLEENMAKLIEDIVNIKKSFKSEDEKLSKIK